MHYTSSDNAIWLTDMISIYRLTGDLIAITTAIAGTEGMTLMIDLDLLVITTWTGIKVQETFCQ